MVNSASGAYFITGDAVFSYSFFEDAIEKNEMDFNPEKTRKSREKIYAFFKAYPEVNFFVGHDK